MLMDEKFAHQPSKLAARLLQATGGHEGASADSTSRNMEIEDYCNSTRARSDGMQKRPTKSGGLISGEPWYLELLSTKMSCDLP